jgi:uncharacterized protein YndB with AHSA1/START domain
MKVFNLAFLGWCLTACSPVADARAADEPVGKSGTEDLEKTMAKLSRLVGGTWVNTEPKFVVELRYEWAFGKKAIRGLGVIDEGGPGENAIEAILGKDTVNKTVYYVNCHGGETVLQGTAKLSGEDVVFEFATIVGKPGKWRETLRFTDNDTMQFTVFGEKDGQWIPVVNQTCIRRKPETRMSEQVVEGVVSAPVDAVWAALVTKEGQESWNVAHAEIDLKIGGKMRTQYDPAGRIGDPNTIENTILCFEPRRMLAIQVLNPPEKFPFKTAIKKVWTVIYFEDDGPSLTSLRIVGNGYSDDEESLKLRSFFEKGNAYTLQKLQEKFAKKAAKASKAG